VKIKKPVKDKVKKPYVHKKTMIVYLILRAIIIAVMIIHAVRKDYESVFVCLLSLVLMLLPSIIERKLWVRLPATLEIIILFFIFAAEILGEINSFYMRIPHWDTMLHTMNGFLCAAIGFALVDLFNRSEKFTFALSPVFLAVVAFCFSMTVGVLWEFFEFGGDRYLGLDMQKDTVVSTINSVNLGPANQNKVRSITDIAEVTIVHSDGSTEDLGQGGYLDVGIIDTMKDLFVNAIGAVVFSVIGYFYVKARGNGKFAAEFIPQVITTEEEKQLFESEFAADKEKIRKRRQGSKKK